MASSTFNAAKECLQPRPFLTSGIPHHMKTINEKGGLECRNLECSDNHYTVPRGRGSKRYYHYVQKSVPGAYYNTHIIDAGYFKEQLESKTYKNPEAMKDALSQRDDNSRNALHLIILNEAYSDRRLPQANEPVILYSDSKNSKWDSNNPLPSSAIKDFVIERRKELLKVVLDVCEKDDDRLVELLCANDRDGYSPMHYCYSSDTAILRSTDEISPLLDRISTMNEGCQTKLTTARTSKEGETILHFMAHHWNGMRGRNSFGPTAVKRGLKTPDAKGNTPIHVIFDAHAITTVDQVRTPPLPKVVWFCDLVSAESKSEKENLAEYFGTNSDRRNPLHLGAVNQTEVNLLAPVCDMLKTKDRDLLLKLVVQPDGKGDTPIDCAVQASKIDRLQTLVGDFKQPEHSTELFTENTLRHACRSGGREVLVYVLNKMEPVKCYQILAKHHEEFKDLSSQQRPSLVNDYDSTTAQRAPLLAMHLKLVNDLRTLKEKASSDAKAIATVTDRLRCFGNNLSKRLNGEPAEDMSNLAKDPFYAMAQPLRTLSKEDSEVYIQFLRDAKDDPVFNVLRASIPNLDSPDAKHDPSRGVAAPAAMPAVSRSLQDVVTAYCNERFQFSNFNPNEKVHLTRKAQPSEDDPFAGQAVWTADEVTPDLDYYHASRVRGFTIRGAAKDEERVRVSATPSSSSSAKNSTLEEMNNDVEPMSLDLAYSDFLDRFRSVTRKGGFDIRLDHFASCVKNALESKALPPYPAGIQEKNGRYYGATVEWYAADSVTKSKVARKFYEFLRTKLRSQDNVERQFATKLFGKIAIGVVTTPNISTSRNSFHSAAATMAAVPPTAAAASAVVAPTRPADSSSTVTPTTSEDVARSAARSVSSTSGVSLAAITVGRNTVPPTTAGSINADSDNSHQSSSVRMTRGTT